jgi:hypothetical protein
MWQTLCITYLRIIGISCGQRAGKSCGSVAAPFFEQATILHENQAFTKNTLQISTVLHTDFVCNFCMFFRHGSLKKDQTRQHYVINMAVVQINDESEKCAGYRPLH